MVCICFNPCLEDHFFVLENKYISVLLSWSQFFTISKWIFSLINKLQKNFYSSNPSWNFLYIHHEYIFSKQILDSEGIHNLQLFNVEFKKLPIYVKKGRFGHHVISDIQNLVYKRFHGFKIPLYHTRNTYLTLIGPKK